MRPLRRACWTLLPPAAVLACVASLQGCQKALFDKDAPRTQYETYDRMRNRAAPLEEPDVFGNPQPALRARLAPPR